jgi:riboflavin biosynthesis pyrimidine reductase
MSGSPLAPTRARAPAPTRAAPRGTEPLQRLYESPVDGPVRTCSVAALADLYDGTLALPLRDDRPTVIANFVETLDGVVALDPDGRTGSGAVSGFSPIDRFVMALLRAMSDVILVGAGTVRASRGTGWTASRVDPGSAAIWRELRRQLGLAPEPTLVIVTANGHLDPAHPAFAAAAQPIVIVAPDATARALRAAGFPAGVSIEAAGDGDSVPADALIMLTARLDARIVLTEGGPRLLAGLAAAGALDELFLTLAPQLVGRSPDTHRLGLVEGIPLWPDNARWAGLASVRRAGDHLFLRYRFSEDAA